MSKDCCHKRTDAIIKVSDPKSSCIKLSNPKQEAWYVCDVDGCLVVDERKRCDKLVSDKATFSVLIELKGGDIEGAFKQIDRTFEYAEVKDKLVGRLCAMIVSRTVRLPNFDGFSRKSKEHFARRHKARFVIERHDRQVCPKKACGI